MQVNKSLLVPQEAKKSDKNTANTEILVFIYLKDNTSTQ